MFVFRRPFQDEVNGIVSNQSYYDTSDVRIERSFIIEPIRDRKLAL